MAESFTIESSSGLVLGFQHEVKSGKVDLLERFILAPEKRFQTTKKAIVSKDSLGIPVAKVPADIGTAKAEDLKTAEDVVLFEVPDDLTRKGDEAKKLEDAERESKELGKTQVVAGP